MSPTLSTASCANAASTRRSSASSARIASAASGPASAKRASFGMGRPLLDPLDIRADTAQLAHDLLIAAVEMVDAADDGFALGGKPGKDQADAGAQVGGHHRGAAQLFHAGDAGVAAVDLDLRAHPRQFGGVHEAVLENGFLQLAGALGGAEQRHHLRLQVGGKT